ncbi:peptidylprolyl isomerase [Tenacibaculum salmonis]|uniref:peptidylprolyl isomerase n=1 Tax=Tenacibaculum sp. P3-BQ1 TaxID=3232310 RepID=UPI0034DFAA0A
MIKFKHLFYFVLVSIFLYSCSSNNNTNIPNFDYEAQAVKDKDTIVKFLKSHYYKDDVDSIKPLITGKTALFTDNRLKMQTVNEYDLDYTYYYFVKKQGISAKKQTTVVDSVFTTYRLSSFVDSDELVKESDLETPTWFNGDYTRLIRGWLYGFSHFKGGTLKTNDDGTPINGPVSYNNIGEGFFLLPSGLAYRNNNKNLLYIINLHDIVEDTDHDLDNVPSILEDVDGDGKPWNDDTDSNQVVNYLDNDDDGDSKLTKNEVDKEGGNPLNNFSDPNKPSTPDFLNRDIYK